MAWDNTHSADLELGSSQYFSRDNDGGAYDLAAGTFECWFMLESLPSVAGSNYLLWKTADGSGGFDIWIGTADNKAHAYLNPEGQQSDSTTVFEVGIWYHLAFAWDANGSELIINGTSEDTGTAYTMQAGAATIGIGGSAGGSYFDGMLDDVRVWNTKRTATLVNANKNAQLAGNEAGLLSYWKLNNAVTDATSGSRTLTNNNTVTFVNNAPFCNQTFTEEVGAPVDTHVFGMTRAISASEIVGAPTDSAEIGWGWVNASKSSSPTWTNLDKS